METVLIVAQIVVGLVLSTLILLQAKGTGMGRSLNSLAYHSRRGVEGLVFRSTILLAIVFVAVSVASQLLA